MPAIKSFGAVVSIHSSIVGGVTDISIPETDTTMIDVTNHGTTGGYREFIAGLKDGGVMTISGHFIAGDPGQGKLQNPTDGEAVSASVVFSDGSSASFEGVSVGYGITNPLDEVVGFSGSFKISGPITIATGV